jgi:hypothetical protein
MSFPSWQVHAEPSQRRSRSSVSVASSRTISSAHWTRFRLLTDSPAGQHIASICPLVRRSGTADIKRRIDVTRRIAVHTSPTISPGDASAAARLDRRTRPKASGQPTDKASVYTVSWAPPAAKAAAIARPAPIPPAARTCTGTASSTSPSSGSSPIVPRTWPPALMPWAMMKSQPASTASNASSREPIA